MTRHDITSHPDVWQLRAWEGEEDRGEKKAELCTFMLPEITNIYSTNIYSSPCSPICLQGTCLLCCQPCYAHGLPYLLSA